MKYKPIIMGVAFLFFGCDHQESKTKTPQPTPDKVQEKPDNGKSLDSAQIMHEIMSAPFLDKKKLMGTWSIDSVYSHFDDGTFMAMEDMHYRYRFNPDGSFTINAAVNSKGTWTFFPDERRLLMENDQQERIINDYVILKDNRLQLIGFNSEGAFISVFHSVN